MELRTWAGTARVRLRKLGRAAGTRLRVAGWQTRAGCLPSPVRAALRVGLRVALLISGAFVGVTPCAAEFPDRPIKLVVYTQPGGSIDLTARQFAEAARRYTAATFVVENIAGAGGLIAMEHINSLPADGFTLLACTKSLIAKAVVAEREDLLDTLVWTGLLLIDPECVITRRDGPISDWPTLLAAARAKPGRQIWLGPGSGTMDHLMAIRIWDAFDVPGRWVPQNSGGQAVAALLGGQGDAYVGNPGDATGRPDLRVSAVSRSSRLPQWPDAPTFGELGHPELDAQFMWRGFALRTGSPPQVVDWYQRLFEQVTNDPKWRAAWEPSGMQVGYLGTTEFTRLAAENRAEFRGSLDRLRVGRVEGGWLVRWLSHGGTLCVIALVNLGVALGWGWRGTAGRWRERLIPLAVLSFCLPLLVQTWQFPPAWEGVGAAAAPRIWLVLTGICALLLVVAPISASAATWAPPIGLDRVVKLLAVIAVQWIAAIVVGYYPAAAVGTCATLALLGERRGPVLLAVTAGWLACAYGVFERLLHVDLPRGSLFS